MSLRGYTVVKVRMIVYDGEWLTLTMIRGALHRTEIQGYQHQAKEWWDCEGAVQQHEQRQWVVVYGHLSERMEATIERQRMSRLASPRHVKSFLLW